MAGEAFMPEPANRVGLPCEQCLETSVNWEDGPDAVQFTRNQRSTRGLPLNPNGVARLATQAIEECRKVSAIEAFLTYERRPDPEQPENRYHGNILFHPDLSRQLQRQIAGALALASRVV